MMYSIFTPINLQVYILRNRQRVLQVIETPLDKFGPEPPPLADDNLQRALDATKGVDPSELGE